MKNKLFTNISLFLANGSVYGLNALYYCFIQIYISKFHPEDVSGILLAIGPFVAIFAPILWGNIADRAKSKNLVLAAAMAGAAVFYFLLMLNQSFWYLAAILVVLMFFMSPFAGILDIITLEYTEEHRVAYGPFRIAGVFFFGLIPMVLTGFTDKNINIIFYAYLVLAAIGIFSVCSSPKVAGHGSEEHKPDMLAVLRDGRLMLMFVLTAISQFTWAYYLNFFPGHLTGDLGYPQTVWGLNTFLTVLGEIPFFLAFNKLFDKFGIKKLLGISTILIILRYFGLALLTNVPMLLGLGVITGLATTVYTYCCSVYITRRVAPENKASANSLMYALANGIPKVLAGVLGGIMTTAIGYTASMLICAVLGIVGLVIFIAAFAKDQALA